MAYIRNSKTLTTCNESNLLPTVNKILNTRKAKQNLLKQIDLNGGDVQCFILVQRIGKKRFMVRFGSTDFEPMPESDEYQNLYEIDDHAVKLDVQSEDAYNSAELVLSRIIMDTVKRVSHGELNFVCDD